MVIIIWIAIVMVFAGGVLGVVALVWAARRLVASKRALLLLSEDRAVAEARRDWLDDALRILRKGAEAGENDLRLLALVDEDLQAGGYPTNDSRATFGATSGESSK